MAETLLSFGVQKVWDLLVRESERLQGVNEQFDELKRDLNLLRSFLEDADAKKHASALVRNCVEEIKEIVFDTEDIIETFLLKEELIKINSIKKKCLRRLSCIRMDHRKIALDMAGISKRISKVIRDMQSFGVQQMIFDGSKYSHPLQEREKEMRKTFPSNNENELVGLEENVKKLVGYLVEEDGIQVVSITGMGGIGKTTLARQVFNHEMVKNQFDGVAWVCISQQFTRTYVWQTILQQLSSKNDKHVETNMNEEDLQKKLFQLLETRTSLIILDDMWREEDWDRIKPVFPPKKGWKVLLTSRNVNVGLHVDPTCVIFKPGYLTHDESWTLFRRIAFPRKETTTEFKVDVEFEEMGRQMINHCGGLPLAVKVLGGLLASQHTLSEWKRISHNIKSNIIGETSFNDRNISSIYHILYLSFEELPIYLKHCFLYLAHFPEDHPIRVWDLSYYWAAEEIPRPVAYKGATIEEVGDGYVEELVKRNMVKRDVSYWGFKTCHMHDMMREVCLRKAEEENFVHVVDTSNSQSPCKSRRMAVHWLDETYDPEAEMVNPKLRSLLFIWNQVSGSHAGSSLWFTRLQLIRILDLSRVDFGEELPSSIGKLIHLRYLSLYDAKLTHLPSSMRNLKQMLYLNLTTRSSPYIPNIMKDMRGLAYLSLPRTMHDKTKLEMGNLVNMEMLVNFSTKHSRAEDLQRMKKLRHLVLYNDGQGCTREILDSSIPSELRCFGYYKIDDEEMDGC
ncbi:PREDICTED: probable disease resistance protein At1g59620 [Camelina sativa]|uniref:Probable disease resistance protein At1g59620 n=1 Tax=Camelina sativa TaxID=90675 RepID=A0ABM0SQL0_CAMSA|nr:PREDICTED: probable disease resistance protein At1g59620 [Camelina sativa]XP_010414694.1 PREDICTED: probable disease resistance protein At1g59620 [Camelina sativa]